MRAPLSWIREYTDLPADLSVEDLAARLTTLGLKLEALERPGADITGPLVIGRVLTMEREPQKNGKTINWCSVDVGQANGTGEPQGIVCGAHNFAPGDLVVVVLPGGVLPGGFALQIDMATKVEEMDGVKLVERATFRKQLPTATIETTVAVDCAGETAKTRSVKMISDGKVVSDNTNNAAQYVPVHFGSAEAMYYKALCGKPVSDAGGGAPAAQ